MQKINPFLWFDNQAEEAANFYLSVFKDSRMMGTMPGPDGKVLGVMFELEGTQFMAINGGPKFTFNESISFYVHCNDQADVDHYWEKLTADGGEESMCGWLKDKYGVSWQIIPQQLEKLMSGPDREKAGRATEAMLKMRKIDIAELEKAAKG